MELLGTTVEETRGWTVVTVTGQVDVATAPRLRQVLTEAQYGGSTRLVVDLDGVEFLDSFGLGVLVGALRRARTHDGELVVVCTRPRLRMLFDIAGLAEALSLVDDVEAVLDPPTPA